MQWRFRLRGGEFVHQVLPGLLRQIVEEAHPLDGIEVVDDGAHLVEGAGVQQHVGVVVRKAVGDGRGQVDRKTPENLFLMLEWEIGKNIGGARRA